VTHNETWYIYGRACLASQEFEREGEASKVQDDEILFLHGRFGNSTLWESLLGSHDLFVKSTSLDFPGFGRSFTLDGAPLSLSEQVALTVEYILSRNQASADKAGKRLLLVGHDLGAAIAQMTAFHLEKTAPSLISGLVLMNTCSLSHFVCPGSTWGLRHKLKKLIKASSGLLPDHKKMINSPKRSTLLNVSETWPDFHDQEIFKESMKRFEKPVLLLWGTLDEMNPPAEAGELMHTYPDIELFQHDLAGHWPWIEHPEWVATKLKEFLFRLHGPLHHHFQENAG
jgi:pimeloyl-ACP methyl ester carboxylesterase